MCLNKISGYNSIEQIVVEMGWLTRGSGARILCAFNKQHDKDILVVFF